MKTVINDKEFLCVEVSGGDVFALCKGINYGYGMSINFNKYATYMEMREKDNQVRLFLFRNKRSKHETDLGWWSDAEVVWSKNEVIHSQR